MKQLESKLAFTKFKVSSCFYLLGALSVCAARLRTLRNERSHVFHLYASLSYCCSRPQLARTPPLSWLRSCKSCALSTAKWVTVLFLPSFNNLPIYLSSATLLHCWRSSQLLQRVHVLCSFFYQASKERRMELEEKVRAELFCSLIFLCFWLSTCQFLILLNFCSLSSLMSPHFFTQFVNSLCCLSVCLCLSVSFILIIFIYKDMCIIFCTL